MPAEIRMVHDFTKKGKLRQPLCEDNVCDEIWRACAMKEPSSEATGSNVSAVSVIGQAGEDAIQELGWQVADGGHDAVVTA